MLHPLLRKGGAPPEMNLFHHSVIQAHLSALKVNSSPGNDDISVRLSKECATPLSFPLSFIFMYQICPEILNHSTLSSRMTQKYMKIQKTLPIRSRRTSIRWCSQWQLQPNIDKCVVLHMGSDNPHRQYLLRGLSIPAARSHYDLVVISTDNLSGSGIYVNA